MPFEFFDNSLGVQNPAILVQNGLKLVPSKALTIVSGFKPWHFLYRMDLSSDKSQKGSLRNYSPAVFAVDFLTIISGVLAPRHHLMMDLELAKPQGKALGLTKPQSIVDFDTLDGKSRAPTWLETKPMMTTDRKLSIVTNKKDLMGWPLPSWGNKLTSFT